MQMYLVKLQSFQSYLFLKRIKIVLTHTCRDSNDLHPTQKGRNPFGPSLRGKALEVYSRLPVSEALNYRSLKQALLKRFQLTEEGFHSKFRTSKPDAAESPSQFFAT